MNHESSVGVIFGGFASILVYFLNNELIIVKAYVADNDYNLELIKIICMEVESTHEALTRNNDSRFKVLLQKKYASISDGDINFCTNV